MADADKKTWGTYTYDANGHGMDGS